MALTNSQYNAFMKTYEDKQLANRRALDEKLDFVNRTIPEYQKLSSEISSLSIEHASRLLEGDETALADLKTSITMLRNQKKQLLANAGLPSDFLEMKYHCYNCKDTGYIGNEKCHCFKQQIISLLYQQSNIKDMLNENNFSTLSYKFMRMKIYYAFKMR